MGKCEAVLKNKMKCGFMRKLFVENISKYMLKVYITCKASTNLFLQTF